MVDGGSALFDVFVINQRCYTVRAARVSLVFRSSSLEHRWEGYDFSRSPRRARLSPILVSFCAVGILDPTGRSLSVNRHIPVFLLSFKSAAVN